MWMTSYRQHAFTTGRRHIPSSKTRPKGSSQTLKQPGKLNLKEFSLVTDAIARMNVSGREGSKSKLSKPGFGHAPLATPENVDLGSEYAQVKDAVPGVYSSYDGEYTYTLVQDAVGGNNKSKLRQRREKGQPSYSDSDSEWSSLERRQRAADIYCKVNRKPTPHKRIRKKRTAIPVPTPRVPPVQPFATSDAAGIINYQLKEEQSRGGCDSSEKVHSETPSDLSDASDPDLSSSTTQPHQNYQKHSIRLKKKSGGSIPLGTAVGPPVVPNPSDVRGSTTLHHPYGGHLASENDILASSKMKMEVSYGIGHDDESSLDVSSPRDVNSPMVKDADKTSRRKEKQKLKSDEKQEKRRQKEEKLKRHAEKEKEREKKRAKQKVKSSPVVHQVTLQDFAQSEDNFVPLLLEKCVKFIEEEGLDSEGIYRVPGNRAHVDLLFQKFEEDPNFSIHDLDIPVNAVATALKDFFSKRLPPLLTQDMLAELEDISGARRINKQVSTAYLNLEVSTDRSCRLLALRGLLKKLPNVNFQVLKFIFQHFVKVSENCKLNSMDSKNLAICWWPTLLPIEFSDMGRFEQMRPHLEDIVQTMIDQYPFLFCGKEAFVMV